MAEVGLSQDYRDLLVCLADARIDGVTFDEAFVGHRTVEVDGRQIPYIGRAALLANRRAAGRAKDLADVEWLETHEEE